MGREAGARVLAAFEAERIVPAFVDSYVRQHNRRELKTSPLRYRELLVTLTRESLLAIAAEMSAELPRRLAGGRRAQTAESVVAADAFLQAFTSAVAVALRWTPGDVAEFAGDVALYARMAAFTQPSTAPRIGANPKSAAAGKRASLHLRSRAASQPVGPFADRCALLLDPSLLERARTAATSLHSKLRKIAGKVLSGVFRRAT